MPSVHKIFGGPGTGKTSRMIEIVREEVARGVPFSRIAFLAHTNAAADEAWSRISRDETKERPPWFCTIHAAARRSIAWPVNKLWSDYHTRKLSQASGMALATDDEADYQPGEEGNKIIQLISLAENKMISLAAAHGEMADPGFGLGDVARLQKLIDQIKTGEGVRDFNDLLTMYVANPVPLPVQVVIIDEAQDLTPLQWRAVKDMWTDAARAYVVGDDDQLIFGFTGAVAGQFLHLPCDKEDVLPVSWRVPRGIGGFADRIISKVKDRKIKNIKWRDDPGTIDRFPLDAHMMRIQEDKDILFLFRHTRMAEKLYKELRGRDIACSLNGRGVLAGDMAKAVVLLKDLEAGQEVSVSKLRAALRFSPKLTTLRLDLKDKFKGARGAKIGRKDLPDIPYADRFELTFGRNNYERAAFAELWRHVIRRGHDNLRTLPPVKIMTMHAAKGREADHVIVSPQCWTTAFDAQDKPGPEGDSETRLCYVAATRAKQRLTILVPGASHMYLRQLVDTKAGS